MLPADVAIATTEGTRDPRPSVAATLAADPRVMAEAALEMGRRRWPAGLAWALWVLTLLGLATTAWLDQLLRQALGHVGQAGVVLDDQLDLASGDRVAVLREPQLHAVLDLLAVSREWAGHRQDESDLQRIGGLRGKRYARCERGDAEFVPLSPETTHLLEPLTTTSGHR